MDLVLAESPDALSNKGACCVASMTAPSAAAEGDSLDSESICRENCLASSGRKRPSGPWDISSQKLTLRPNPAAGLAILDAFRAKG
jgi:hypothetical protein